MLKTAPSVLMTAIRRTKTSSRNIGEAAKAAAAAPYRWANTKKGESPRPKSFHNGIILIVIS